MGKSVRFTSSFSGREIFKRIEDGRGEFLAMDKENANCQQL